MGRQILYGCLLAGLFAGFTCSAQPLQRYDLGCDDFSLYNPASSGTALLSGSGGASSLQLFGRYSFDDSSFYGENPLDLLLRWNGVTSDGGFSASVRYDGYSYYDIHSVCGSYRHVFTFGNDSRLSIGAGLSADVYDIRFGELPYSTLATGRTTVFRPDFDLGAEYDFGIFTVGMCLKNIISRRYAVDGEVLARAPRSFLANFACRIPVCGDFTVSPFCLCGYSQGTVADLGTSFRWRERAFVSYTLRTFEIRNIISAGAALTSHFSLASAVSFGPGHDGTIVSLLCSIII